MKVDFLTSVHIPWSKTLSPKTPSLTGWSQEIQFPCVREEVLTLPGWEMEQGNGKTNSKGSFLRTFSL